MKAFFQGFKKWLGAGTAAPPESSAALPDRPEDYKYLDHLGLYKHQTKSGYFCSHCKGLLKVHRDGWLCTACGRLHRDPTKGTRNTRTR